MFSLPRDTVDVPSRRGPRDASGAASTATRSTRSSRTTAAAPTSGPGNDRTRGYNAPQGRPRQPVRPRHQVLRRGQLRRLQEGRRRPRRRDDQRPGAGPRRRLPGDRRATCDGSTSRRASSTWTAPQALRYARSRHTLDDFDRGARQQRVLLSLREQADPADADPAAAGALSPPSRRRSRPTSRSTSCAELLGLATQVDTQNIRSYVFSPPLYATQIPASPRGYIVPAQRRRRSGRRSRTRSRSTRELEDAAPAPRRARAPRSGSSTATRHTSRGDAARRLPRVPRARRVRAAPAARPAGVPADTQIVVYNGAEDEAARRRSPTSRRRSSVKVELRRPTRPIRGDIVDHRSATDAGPRGRPPRSDARARGARRRRSGAGAPAQRDRREPVPVLAAAARGRRRSSGRERAARSARSRPTRSAGGRPR